MTKPRISRMSTNEMGQIRPISLFICGFPRIPVQKANLIRGDHQLEKTYFMPAQYIPGVHLPL